MKLNMNIVYECLDGDKRLVGVESQDFMLDLEGIRLFSETAESPDCSHLYIVKHEDVASLTAFDQRLHMIIIGDIDDSFIQENNHQAIILRDGIGPTDLLNKLLCIFEHYQDWHRRLDDALLAGASLQDIFDIGAEVLDNPLALLDNTMSLVIKAGNLPEDINGTIWEVLLTEGRTPEETLPIHIRSQVDSRLLNGSYPFLISAPENLKDKTWMLCGIYVRDHFFGSFGAVELFAPFTSGQLALTAELKIVMEEALLRNMANFEYLDGFSLMNEGLINGYPIVRNIIDYHLKLRGWSDGHFVLYLFRGEDTIDNREQWHKYLPSLKSIFPDAHFMVRDDCILMIARCTGLEGETGSHGIDNHRLINYLKLQGLHVGKSMAFREFSHLRYAYDQATVALAVHQAEPLCDFEEEYPNCLQKLLSASISPQSLVHPDILMLWTGGKARDRENIVSLESYLQNGFNLSLTARKLHVHRNTLAYRLDCIGRDLGINLAELTDQRLLLIQLSCLIVRQI